MQSKKHSFIESVTNVLVGYWVSVLSQLLIFPLFGVHLRIEENLLISFYFTLISIGRSYSIRRLFNRKQSRNPIMDMEVK
ncbi:hypothetical protein P0F15_000525 [Vibrio metschnikovii]|jgi:hypothetical protein|uniref:Uncharacterized protein n=2 Tax=Unclassified Bacteria TaxID=49928 RepID=A0AAU6V9T0_UNCXX|nr:MULTISPECIES: hypothetical protein [unclassified Vibrio]EKO3598849.1 hypothetical protein [Vibrio metschnikovii]EKO3650564.1 hypothetical protein [Vibrio metschnikovii]EKO3662161.1 hypothetical protein [Vibrio metschnikovii]EKO3679207.1 hypothetical protein [Vibrio metschnikovii]EKO3731100.1 hypothetical protein [Vibrio metschnikovii]